MAEEIFKVIFQLEAQGQGVFDEINKVKGKYVEVNAELNKQAVKLHTLMANEAALLKARAAANSVTAVAKYNTELGKVQKQIDATTKSITELTKGEKSLSDATSKLGKDINNAFKTTQVNAMDNEIKKLTNDFKESGNSGAEGFAKTEVKAQSLRSQLKVLKAQLAETDDDKEFLRLSIEAGKLEDKIGDANDAARIFATDSPFEAVGNSIGSVGSKLLALDFEGAAKSSQLLVKASSAITFKGALTGIGQLGKTLLNVGKALLTNPLFLLGAVIIFIITKFNDLKNSGGVIGKVFSFIGDVIGFVVDQFFALTDAIGLTNQAFDKFISTAVDGLQAVIDKQTKLRGAAVEILKAMGKDTEAAEKKNLEFTRARIKDQIALLEFAKAVNGKLTEDQVKQEEELKDKYLDTFIEIEKNEAASTKKRSDAGKKYAEERLKILDDLDKRLREEQQKTSEFNIKIKLPQDSKQQLEATFKLRNQLEIEAFNELEKTSLKGLKNQKDRDLAKVKLAKIREQEILNLQNDFNEANLNLAKANGDKFIEARRNQDNLLLDNFIATSQEGTFTEGQQLEKRLDIQRKFFNDSIALAEADIKARKGKGFDTTDQEKALTALKLDAATKEAQAEKEINEKKLEEEQKFLDARKAHTEEVLKLNNSRNSTILDNEVDFEKSRLLLLKESGKEFTDEYQAQQDKVLALEKEAKKQRLLENIGYFETITAAAIKATNDIIAAKIKEVDEQSALQSKRVDDAKRLAEQGNAVLLEEEQKRQDDLLKEREKFVRAQQALAVVELISNSAIAVSKAAAQGGVAAGITIAATIIALIAGLAQARSIASQAAFYEGGYTGDGNAREESSAIGKKPYTYHKGEFVFDHKKTQKYKPIFQDIHEGKIDLVDWHEKVKAFNDFGRFAQFNMGANLNPNSSQIINNTVQITELKGQMAELIHAVKSQGFALNVDGDGFSGFVTKVNDRHNFIKNTLAK